MDSLTAMSIEDEHMDDDMSSHAADGDGDDDAEFTMVKDHEESDDADIVITIKFPPEKFNGKWSVAADATLSHMLLHASEKWPEYNWAQSKAIVEQRVPGFSALLKSPADDATPIAPLHENSLRVMAPKISVQRDLEAARNAALLRRAARTRSLPLRLRSSKPSSRESNPYTFLTIRPLNYLPNPRRSEDFLKRLRSDPGIRTVMRTHKFSVGLLTEMDPGQYTESNHEGTTRILGLNRNRGEVIELRLRTDAYDGYRDYKTIRNTLCHELAHNVHSEHDRDFWDLCHQIEREVHKADWLKSGRTAGGEEYAPPPPGEEEEEHPDEGGWTGGQYTLGGGGENNAGLSRREIIARATEARLRRERRNGGSGGSRGQEGQSRGSPSS
ncbi:WLM domain-containing protein [Podospora conica]|nr:WLM domain-containing protein [Schizothecium conicum]